MSPLPEHLRKASSSNPWDFLDAQVRQQTMWLLLLCFSSAELRCLLSAPELA